MRNALGESADVAATPLIHIVEQLRRTGPARADATLSDAQLLKRFIDSRDEAAFAGLVRRHGPMVLGVCRRVLANSHDAEDAFQATFLVLAQKARTLRLREALGSWLYGVAFRLARRTLADSARRRFHESRARVRSFPDTVAEITLREAQVALDEALTRLPERYRAPLVLCCLEGKSRDEAAQELHCSLNTLKNRLERGRELLRRKLGGHNLALP